MLILIQMSWKYGIIWHLCSRGWTYVSYGYYATFGLSAVVSLLGVAYVFFFLEDAQQIKINREKIDSVPNVVSLRNILNTLKIVKRKREGYKKHILILGLCMLFMWDFHTVVRNLLSQSIEK